MGAPPSCMVLPQMELGNSVAAVVDAALAAAVLDKPKKLTQAGSCLNHV